MTEKPTRHGTAAAAILGASVAWAFIPALIHWFLSTSNAFMFSAWSQLVECTLLLIFLFGSRQIFEGPRQLFGKLPSRPSQMKPLWLVCFQPSTDRSTYDVDQARTATDLIRLPLLMIVLASFNYALFALATQFVETAIAAAIYETWPLFVVLGLARAETTDAKYRQVQSTHRTTGVLEYISLSSIATVGLLFMLLSQSPAHGSPFSIRTLIGMTLALLAAPLSGLNVVASIIYGRVLYYWLTEPHSTKSERNPRRIDDRGRDDRLLLLWLTVLAATFSRFISIPIQFIVGLLIEKGDLAIEPRGILGASLLGLAGATAIALRRVGNIAAASPGVNALAYTAPVLALLILMIAGIELRRFELFLIGASLILAINVLIQLKPDQETDVVQFGKDPRAGARLGFTVLIISLWGFGTVIYLRDDFLPPDWLSWSTGDYWTLLGLSATVFALILGFRMTRLSERMRQEDALMLKLFRNSERLQTTRLFHKRFWKLLTDLDTTNARTLERTHHALCRRVGLARKRDLQNEHEEALHGLQVQLDLLAHSKQQGRDIVELISLTLFALVTIMIGLLARQVATVSTDSTAWSGFLSEVFVLLFSSTIAFLLINLFDQRREREAPLIVNDQELEGRYRLFFRNKERLAGHLVGAILISVVMAALFIGLLYDKWLG